MGCASFVSLSKEIYGSAVNKSFGQYVDRAIQRVTRKHQRRCDGSRPTAGV